MGTIGSIIDSIGDYYACAKVCDAPPPPKHAVNRGIAVEGFMSVIAGWAGAGHATSTFGGNIGAIGITKVLLKTSYQLQFVNTPSKKETYSYAIGCRYVMIVMTDLY